MYHESYFLFGSHALGSAGWLVGNHPQATLLILAQVPFDSSDEAQQVFSTWCLLIQPSEAVLPEPHP